MAKLTIVIEDTADGAVFISGDPSVEELLERAKQPGSMTSAEGYACIAWIALRQEAQRSAKEAGGQWAAWDDGRRTVN